MKNLKISVCFFLTAGFLLTAGTAAYLSASDQKVNTLAVGHVTTEIEENFSDPTPTPVEENPSYIKEIWAGNFSGGERGFHADCYVRMALSFPTPIMMLEKGWNFLDWIQ